MFKELADLIGFGRKIYAHGKWWTRLQELQHGVLLVTKSPDELPCRVYIVRPTDEDKRHEILFRNFKEKKS